MLASVANKRPRNTPLQTTFLAGPQDQVLRICTEIGSAGPIIMQLSFPGRLDEARLGKAARLLLDAEPILGCRFDPDPIRPVWRRRDDLDGQNWCEVVVAADADAVARELLVPRPVHLEQVISFYLVRQPGGDTLLMWLSHLVADGAAATACASQLAAIYTNLATDHAYQPSPDSAPRNADIWLSQIGWRDTARILRRDVKDAIEGRTPTLGFMRDFDTFCASPPLGADFVKRRITREEVAVISRLAREQSCTRNDLLIAAFLCAFAAFAPPRPGAQLRVAATVDLRLYAPPRRRPMICSMVGVSFVSAGKDANPRFPHVLTRVAAVTRRQKKALMGAPSPLYMAFMRHTSFRRKRSMVTKLLRRIMSQPMAPTFSNGGRLVAAKLRFDGVAPADAGFVVYPAPLPGFLVGAVEYEGVITLTSCFQPSELEHDKVAALLDRMVQVILCGQFESARDKEVA